MTIFWDVPDSDALAFLMAVPEHLTESTQGKRGLSCPVVSEDTVHHGEEPAAARCLYPALGGGGAVPWSLMGGLTSWWIKKQELGWGKKSSKEGERK